MKNNLIYSTIYLLILVAFSSCNEKHLHKDMVTFDRAFIPVYYYTAIGDMKGAKTAMFPLNSKWAHFQSAYHLKDTDSEDWNETIRMIGAWMEEANCAIQEKDAVRALVQLDHARYELVDLRIRKKMNNYYLDYLWDLEASIYEVIEVANDPKIDLFEFNEFEALSQEVDYAWLKVLQRSFDQHLFDCTANELRYVNDQKEKLSYAVVSLLQAIETADRTQFAAAANALEPAYLNYMAMFGDFKSVETFYALK